MSYADRLKALRGRQIDDLLAPLRDKFLAELPAQAEALDGLMMAAEQGIDPRAALGQIRTIVHRLSGVASILSQAEVGRLAQRAESLVSELLEGEGPTLDEVGDALDRLVVEMERRVAEGSPEPASRPAPMPRAEIP